MAKITRRQDPPLIIRFISFCQPAMREPTHSLPSAYWTFVEGVRELESSDGLLVATTAIAMNCQQDASVEQVRGEIQQMAETVRKRVRTDDSRALLAHLHQHLFEELEFRGNTNRFYDPHNSFLPFVLRTRRGLPITLALVYKLVADRIGLAVEGVNAPGHFLLRVQVDSDELLVDAFHAGRIVNVDEALLLVKQVTGQDELSAKVALQVASQQQWLARILANLLHVYSMQGDVNRISAMSEMYDVVMGVDA